MNWFRGPCRVLFFTLWMFTFVDGRSRRGNDEASQSHFVTMERSLARLAWPNA